MDKQYPQRNFQYASEGIVVCSKCQTHVMYEDLPYIKSKADGKKLSYCRKCRYAQVSKHAYTDTEAFFRHKSASMRKSVRSPKSVAHGRTYDLPDNYLLALWRVQQETCFYTDKKLVISQSNPYMERISIDRVDTSKNYIPGNVVIASNRANTMKGNLSLEEIKEYLPLWYSRICERLPLLNLKVERAFND